jgi:RNase H-fold protein (predicted Holliday junction resolvase)
MDVKFMIAVTEATEAAKEKSDLISKILAAMEVTKNHWMLTDEDLRFKAAVAGVINSGVSNEEGKSLLEEMKALSLLSDYLEGAPVDFSLWINPKTTLGLMNFWVESKGKEKK